jgi:GntR family transcriptional regulator / MocR family aminotransferase
MSRRTAAVELAGLNIDRSSSRPLHRQLYSAIKDAILSGRLRAGARLPSSRMLAASLGVSRFTVVTALELLHADGLTDSRGGSATLVALRAQRRAPQRAVPSNSSNARLPIASTRATEVAAIMASGRPCPMTRLFMAGTNVFPWKVWARLTRDTHRLMLRESRTKHDVLGYRPLREAVTAFVASARGVRCTPDQIVIVPGASYALDVALRTLANPGDVVWLEDPSCVDAPGTVAAAGCRFVPIPVDARGLRLPPDDAAAIPRLIVVTPSRQFPLGVRMAEDRRLALLAYARQVGAAILEFDHDSVLHYQGRPPVALHALDESERVVHIGSFSTTLSPALGIAYLVLPTHLIAPFTTANTRFDATPVLSDEITLAHFMAEGHLSAHLARMRRLYQARQQELLEVLRARVGSLIDVPPTDTGFHFIGWLSDGIDANRVADAMADSALAVRSLADFRLAASGPPGLVVGFGSASHAEIRPAASLLATAIERHAIAVGA